MKRIAAFFIITVIALAFGACAPKDEPVNTQEPAVTDAPSVTEEPDPADELIGAWQFNAKATLILMNEDERIEFESALEHGFDMEVVFGSDGAGSMTVKNGSVSNVSAFSYRAEDGVLLMEKEGSGERDVRQFEFADGILYLWKDGSALAFDRR